MAVKKTETKKKVTTEKEVEQIQTKEPIIEAKKRYTSRELRKLISKDLEVTIMNTCPGTFYYECPRTGMVIELDGFGDCTEVEIEVLNTMKSRAKGIFKSFMIMVVDVISDEFDLEDILTYLSLDDKYKGLDIYDGECLDDIILKSTSDEFLRFTEKSDINLCVQIAKRCITLFREGEHDIQYRANTLCKRLGVEDIFLIE